MCYSCVEQIFLSLLTIQIESIELEGPYHCAIYCTISTYPAGQQSALPPPPDLGRTVSSQTDAGRQIRPMVGTGVVKFSRLRRTVGLPLAQPAGLSAVNPPAAALPLRR